MASSSLYVLFSCFLLLCSRIPTLSRMSICRHLLRTYCKTNCRYSYGSAWESLNTITESKKIRQTATITVLPAKFTIHGVWPTNISNAMARCLQAKQQHPFDPRITTSLQADLVQSWPSFETEKKKEQFWKHEYEKHGSCTAPAITQKAYFERAHALWKQYDIYTVLDRKNIKPGHSYSLGDFEAAVKTKIGTNKIPVILCKEVKPTPGSNTTGLILREIIICFDHGGTNLVNCTRTTDCNKKMSTTTTNMIYYV